MMFDGDRLRLGGHRVNWFNEGESMEVGIPGTDTADAMLAHEARRLDVVPDISRQRRHIASYVVKDGAMPVGRSEDAEAMARQHRIEKADRCWTAPGVTEHSGVRDDAQELVANAPREDQAALFSRHPSSSARQRACSGAPLSAA
jgi:hypothetical protein